MNTNNNTNSILPPTELFGPNPTTTTSTTSSAGVDTALGSSSITTVEQKKRGRKRKVVAEDEIKKIPKKKKGMFIKNMFGNSSDPQETDINCNTITNHGTSRKSHYLVSNLCLTLSKDNWPAESTHACLQDSHLFSGKPVMIPYDYKFETDEYSLFGNFCSFSCAKQYIQEQGYSNQREQLSYLSKLERDVFGIANPEKPAPPRMKLKMYGGDLEVDEYRAASTLMYHIVHQPPCVTHMMMIEAQPLGDQEFESQSKSSERFTNQIFSLRGITAPKSLSSQSKSGTNTATGTTNLTLSTVAAVGVSMVDAEPTKTPYEEYCEKKTSLRIENATSLQQTVDNKKSDPKKPVASHFEKFLKVKKTV